MAATYEEITENIKKVQEAFEKLIQQQEAVEKQISRKVKIKDCVGCADE